MKRIICSLILFNSIVASQITTNIDQLKPKDPRALRIMSYNFQSIFTGYTDIFKTEDRKRLDYTVDMIQKISPDIIGFQEPHAYDFAQFEQKLSNYGWFGEGLYEKTSSTLEKYDPLKLMQKTGAKPIIDRGDINGIMYKKIRVALADQGTFWLNPGMKQYQAGWGANSMRGCTWGKFIDMKTRKVFWVFNTHLDHKSEQARSEGFKLILQMMNEKTRNGQEPAIIMGDLNWAATYKIKNLDNTLLYLKDAAKAKVGPNFSFIGQNTTLDYIFINSSKFISSVDQYATIDYTQNGKSPSDHRPVVVDMQLK